MKLKRLFPTMPEWDELIRAGAQEFLVEKMGMEAWSICAPNPIGVLAFESIAPGVRECELWVREDRRGRWWSRSFYSMLLGIGFFDAETIVAGVVEGSPSHRIVQRMGWNKYCQRDGLSYYQITRKDCMGEQPYQA